MMKIYAMHDHDKGLKKKGCFPIRQEDATRLNEQGYGIFFTPNVFNGARLEENLAGLRMWFVDIDKGDKYSMENAIASFELEPSLLIETKSGYHAYWKCEPNLFEDGLVDEYVDILNRLVDYFNADTNAMGTNRILRVPNFYHSKDSKNKFLITEIFRSENIYTLDQMEKALPKKEQEVKSLQDDRRGEFFETFPTDDFWQRVFDLDCFNNLEKLSGCDEVRGEVFRVERVGSKGKIYVDDNLVESCWIDPDGKIGSHAKGGPSLANWLKWYGHDYNTIARCLKKYIPGLQRVEVLPEGFR